MTRVTYSQVGDLLIGDVPLAPHYGDGTKLVENAADDIDAQLGHIYVTPFVIADTPVNRPSLLLLKKINNLLASGRLIMDMALGGEDTQTNAYARTLYNEALANLKQLTKMQIVLNGADLLPDEEAQLNTGPVVNNEDSISLVENFYAQTSGRWRVTVPVAAPYGANTPQGLVP